MNQVLSRRRWIVLMALMAVTLVCEVQWLSHAAVARPAAVFYAGQFDPSSIFNIDFLSMSYMLVFLLACLPASWVLNRYGLGAGVGIGAMLTILGSLGKALWAHSFAMQILFQLILACGQPFLTNAATTLAFDWFPVRERATASGLASLAQYLGFVVALALSPIIVQSDPLLPAYGSGMEKALFWYAVLGVAAGLFALVFVRRGPNRDVSLRAVPFFSSLKQLIRQRDFRLTLLLFFLGLGIMNTVTALTDGIASSLGVMDSDGLLGVGLIIGGIAGAVILPILSDKYGKRKAFLVLCMAMTVPSLWAFVLAPRGYYALGIGAMFLLGFALLSAGPIGFQYAAELSSPVPEAASQGALLLAGQISGLLFTGIMSSGGSAAIRIGLIVFAVLSVFMTLLSLLLHESPAVDKLV